MKKSPLKIIVKENGKKIGSLRPDEFMQHMSKGSGTGKFLSDYVKIYNENNIDQQVEISIQA